MPLPPTLRNCLFTADDWGLSSAVNEGIFDLAARGIVTRVSVLANGEYLESGLGDLAKLPGVTLGLHFNLTYGPVPRSVMADPAARLLVHEIEEGTGAKWEYPGTLPRAALRIVFERLMAPHGLALALQAHLRGQLSALERLGVHVSYLDGHHHVHILPGVLRALAPVLRERGIRQVRVPFDSRMLATIRAPLPLMAWPARYTVMRLGLEALPFHYPRLRDMQDQEKWARDLQKIAGSGPTEMVVHPARRDDVASLEYPDSYGAGRVTEYRALLRLDR